FKHSFILFKPKELVSGDFYWVRQMNNKIIVAAGGEIGLDKIALVGNKIRGEKDMEFLKQHLPDFEFLGFLPYDDALIEADLNGMSPYDVDSRAKTEIESIISRL
ncbi:MAG: hypothetical protein ACQERN_07775, partial [Thermodesulfobacteriota bacterium]